MGVKDNVPQNDAPLEGRVEFISSDSSITENSKPIARTLSPKKMAEEIMDADLQIWFSFDSNEENARTKIKDDSLKEKHAAFANKLTQYVSYDIFYDYDNVTPDIIDTEIEELKKSKQNKNAMLKRVDYWLSVMQICYERGNYDAFIIIHSAFSSTPLIRLIEEELNKNILYNTFRSFSNPSASSMRKNEYAQRKIKQPTLEMVPAFSPLLNEFITLSELKAQDKENSKQQVYLDQQIAQLDVIKNIKKRTLKNDNLLVKDFKKAENTEDQHFLISYFLKPSATYLAKLKELNRAGRLSKYFAKKQSLTKNASNASLFFTLREKDKVKKTNETIEEYITSNLSHVLGGGKTTSLSKTNPPSLQKEPKNGLIQMGLLTYLISKQFPQRLADETQEEKENIASLKAINKKALFKEQMVKQDTLGFSKTDHSLMKLLATSCFFNTPLPDKEVEVSIGNDLLFSKRFSPRIAELTTLLPDKTLSGQDPFAMQSLMYTPAFVDILTEQINFSFKIIISKLMSELKKSYNATALLDFAKYMGIPETAYHHLIEQQQNNHFDIKENIIEILSSFLIATLEKRQTALINLRSNIKMNLCVNSHEGNLILTNIPYRLSDIIKENPAFFKAKEFRFYSFHDDHTYTASELRSLTTLIKEHTLALDTHVDETLDMETTIDKEVALANTTPVSLFALSKPSTTTLVSSEKDNSNNKPITLFRAHFTINNTKTISTWIERTEEKSSLNGEVTSEVQNFPIPLPELFAAHIHVKATNEAEKKQKQQQLISIFANYTAELTLSKKSINEVNLAQFLNKHLPSTFGHHFLAKKLVNLYKKQFSMRWMDTVLPAKWLILLIIFQVEQIKQNAKSDGNFTLHLSIAKNKEYAEAMLLYCQYKGYSIQNSTSFTLNAKELARKANAFSHFILHDIDTKLAIDKYKTPEEKIKEKTLTQEEMASALQALSLLRTFVTPPLEEATLKKQLTLLVTSVDKTILLEELKNLNPPKSRKEVLGIITKYHIVGAVLNENNIANAFFTHYLDTAVKNTPMNIAKTGEASFTFINYLKKFGVDLTQKISSANEDSYYSDSLLPALNKFNSLKEVEKYIHIIAHSNFFTWNLEKKLHHALQQLGLVNAENEQSLLAKLIAHDKRSFFTKSNEKTFGILLNNANIMRKFDPLKNMKWELTGEKQISNHLTSLDSKLTGNKKTSIVTSLLSALFTFLPSLEGKFLVLEDKAAFSAEKPNALTKDKKNITANATINYHDSSAYVSKYGIHTHLLKNIYILSPSLRGPADVFAFFVTIPNWFIFMTTTLLQIALEAAGSFVTGLFKEKIANLMKSRDTASGGIKILLSIYLAFVMLPGALFYTVSKCVSWLRSIADGLTNLVVKNLASILNIGALLNPALKIDNTPYPSFKLCLQAIFLPFTVLSKMYESYKPVKAVYQPQETIKVEKNNVKGKASAKKQNNVIINEVFKEVKQLSTKLAAEKDILPPQAEEKNILHKETPVTEDKHIAQELPETSRTNKNNSRP